MLGLRILLEVGRVICGGEEQGSSNNKFGSVVLDVGPFIQGRKKKKRRW